MLRKINDLTIVLIFSLKVSWTVTGKIGVFGISTVTGVVNLAKTYIGIKLLIISESVGVFFDFMVIVFFAVG